MSVVARCAVLSPELEPSQDESVYHVIDDVHAYKQPQGEAFP
jgi:hypothetical protein